MSDITTTALFVSRIGTGWTIDVTALNLSDILPLKDFQVVDVAAQVFLSVANFTKTSSTVLTYTGPALLVATALEIRRDTPISERYYKIPHGSYLNSQALNEEVDRILRKLNEIEGFPGSVLGAFILDQEYGPAWATDNITARTAANVYNVIETLATDAALDAAVTALNTTISTGLAQRPTSTVVSNAIAAAITAAPAYKLIGTFNGNGTPSGTLDLSAIAGNIVGDRLHFEYEGIFETDTTIFVRPAGVVAVVANAGVLSSVLNGTPTYNAYSMGSYGNSFWLGYCEAAANSRLWGNAELQLLASASSKEIHCMSHAMFHSPSLNYGVADIRGLAANNDYNSLKTTYTFFAADPATAVISRNIPTNFSVNVFAYVTP